MSGPDLVLRPAEDLAYVERLLDANGLPSDDVRARPDCFSVAVAGGERVGVGGVEQYGTAGLLRSLVVAEPARGRGYGTALCDALEARARNDGIETLYLLTTTAADFFAARGYVEIERSDAAEAIRSTAEFADLCPASATPMRTDL